MSKVTGQEMSIAARIMAQILRDEDDARTSLCRASERQDWDLTATRMVDAEYDHTTIAKITRTRIDNLHSPFAAMDVMAPRTVY